MQNNEKLNLEPNNPKTAKLICNTLSFLIQVWTFCRGVSTFLTTMVYFLDGLWLSLSLQYCRYDSVLSLDVILLIAHFRWVKKDKDIILLFDICFAVWRLSFKKKKRSSKSVIASQWSTVLSVRWKTIFAVAVFL